MANVPSTFLDQILMKLIQAGGTLVPTRAALNFLGAGVTVVDNPGNDSTDVTIAGGGGGGAADTIFTGNNANIDASGVTGNALGYFKALTANRTYKLPAAPTPGFRHTMKDLDGSLTNFSLTFLRNGSGNIDNVAVDLVIGPDPTLAKASVTLEFVGGDGWVRI